MEVDKLEYFNELQVIHDNINVFYEKLFDSEEEEYNYITQVLQQRIAIKALKTLS